MTAMEASRLKTPKGHAKPRISPPIPARSDLEGLREAAAVAGVTFMPWQDTAGRYIEALAPDDRHLYREIGLIVSRQNGKTEILIPTISKRLRAGRRIMHTAQDRALPREVFYEVADIFWDHYRDLFPERNGRATKPRYANGQEEIRLSNGGVYSIVAPTRGGARGPTRDDVIVDELREMDAWDFIAAAKPTMTVSPDPQIIYLSNMGDDRSIVLNALRSRRDEDPSLAYLEWSADPKREADDVKGWAEANPSMGNEAEGMGPMFEYLQAEYRTAMLEGTIAIFETEHLTRAVVTLRAALTKPGFWAACEAKEVIEPKRPMMAVSMSPDGSRAAAAIAWQRPDDLIGFRLLADFTGSPIKVEKIGPELAEMARNLGVPLVGFDPLTDATLAKYFRKTEKMQGAAFANATSDFVMAVDAKKIQWDHAASVGEDLTWTAKKNHDDSGSFQAVRADDGRPITAALAAIRAVGMASAPRPSSVYDERGLVSV